MALTAARFFEARATVYRRTWRGSIITTFLNPILYLAAMGVGLGTLVDDGSGAGAVSGLSYLEFLGPGLLAATAMQVATADGTWPVMGGIRWQKTYDAVLATPLGIRDIVYGHLMWTAVRLAFTSVVFVAVLALFNAIDAWPGALAVGPAVLTGLAFAAPAIAMTSRARDEQGIIMLFRFGIIPMFLFSGTFFPVSQLPDWMEPLAYLTPLWHGVEMGRAFATDIPSTWWAGFHAAYLALWIAAGIVLSIRFLGARMRP